MPGWGEEAVRGPAERRGDTCVLVVDDDPSSESVIGAALAEAGFRVEIGLPEEPSALDSALDRADLVILGDESPATRRTVLADLPGRTRPAVVLVGRDSGARAVKEALDGGADDYLVRPVHPDELAARARAVLRRTKSDPGLGCIEVDGVIVDLDRRVATRDGDRIGLSRVEWLLLEQLALHPGEVVPHRTLLAHVWGLEREAQGHWLRVWIGRLRRRLGWTARRGQGIVSVPGVGYRLAATECAEEPPDDA